MRQRFRILLTAALLAVSAPCAAQSPTLTPKADLQYLVNGRRPIWMGPFIRYTVYATTTVEARIYGLSGELITVISIGPQEPGQYTVPFDGTLDNGAIVFDGKYLFELYFGDDYAAKFWFICRPLSQFGDEQPS
ncbi:MAG TPA: FlgD immunoglobulin-like domain containing protein [bacterium]|nr:FlgD immunoglobulin-like domain containing protein [bacterium]